MLSSPSLTHPHQAARQSNVRSSLIALKSSKYLDRILRAETTTNTGLRRLWTKLIQNASLAGASKILVGSNVPRIAEAWSTNFNPPLQLPQKLQTPQPTDANNRAAAKLLIASCQNRTLSVRYPCNAALRLPP